MAVQVSVFLQDQPGRLEGIVKALSGAGINIRATAIASSEGFGVAKFLVDQPGEAATALRDWGFSVSLKSVVAVVLDDKIGGLARVLPYITEKGINVQDAYGFITAAGEEAIFVFEVEEPEELEAHLREKDCHVLEAEVLYGL